MTGSPAGGFVLVLSCPDRPGIIRAVAGHLADAGGNVVDSQQFADPLKADVVGVVSNHPDLRGLLSDGLCAELAGRAINIHHSSSADPPLRRS